MPLSKLLLELTKYLNIYKRYESEHEMGKFLIGESKHSKLIFSLSSVDAKIAILHYLSHCSEGNRNSECCINQIKNMMELVQVEES